MVFVSLVNSLENEISGKGEAALRDFDLCSGFFGDRCEDLQLPIVDSFFFLQESGLFLEVCFVLGLRCFSASFFCSLDFELFRGESLVSPGEVEAYVDGVPLEGDGLE